MGEDKLMEAAIRVALAGIDAGQTPFGAIVVRDGRIVAEAHNSVWLDGDPTAHAEVNVIRRAAATLGTIDLSGCVIYSTCEPCPMCLSAIHWAKLDRVVFGARIADAQAAGFSELPVNAETLASMGLSPLQVEGDRLRDRCAALFVRWREAGRSRAY